MPMRHLKMPSCAQESDTSRELRAAYRLEPASVNRMPLGLMTDAGLLPD